MAKQRFVVYKAFDKRGDLVGQLHVAGGRLMPFCQYGGWSTYKLETDTASLMNFYSIPLSLWRSRVKSQGACRFQKVIYFN